MRLGPAASSSSSQYVDLYKAEERSRLTVASAVAETIATAAMTATMMENILTAVEKDGSWLVGWLVLVMFDKAKKPLHHPKRTSRFPERAFRFLYTYTSLPTHTYSLP